VRSAASVEARIVVSGRASNAERAIVAEVRVAEIAT